NRGGPWIVTGVFGLAGVWLLGLLLVRLEQLKVAQNEGNYQPVSMQKNPTFTTQTPTNNPFVVAPSRQADPNLARGEILFRQNCAICHGFKGDGNGVTAVLLDPKPRDFHLGKYRIISSGNQIPFREDVIHTIRNGMAGTSMPAWMQLPQSDVEALADYVLSI